MNRELRRIRWSLIPTLLVLFVVTACGSGSAGEEGGGDGVIRIGAAISTSGLFAYEGEQTKNGYEIWADLVNESGGIEVAGKKHKVEMVYYDDESNPETAARVVERLITRDKVDFLFGPFSSGITISVSPVTERNRKILIAGGAASDAVFERDFRYLFGTLALTREYTRTGLEALAKAGVKTVGIISTDEGAFAILPDQTEEIATDLGLDVVSTSVVPGTATDVTGAMRKVRDSNPQALLQMGQVSMCTLMLETVRQLDWSPEYLWNLCAFDPAMDEELGADAMAGVLAPTHWHKDAKYQDDFFGTAHDYYDRYVEATGDEPGYIGPGASAAGLALTLAIEKADSLDPEKVRAALVDLEADTFFGPINFSDPGDPSGLTGANLAKTMLTVQIQPDGSRTVIAPESAATDTLQPFTPWNER